MAKNLGTVWELDPHTAAKHMILRRYLQAWLPILSHRNERVLYLDGFAGPGIYSEGEPGSPIIALRTAIGFIPRITADLLFLFIESDRPRYDSLQREVAKLTLPSNIHVQLVHGKCNETMNDVLDDVDQQGKHLIPTFAFLDPFGFSHTPFSLIKRIARHPHCEVLITFMYEEINRFLDADYTNKAAQYDALFGTTEWRTITQSAATSQERRNKLHNLYQNRLKQVAGVHYVRSFCMRNQHNATDYFLFFGTNSLRGMEKMKQAMWKVDSSGTYEFSDFSNPYQPWLLSHLDESVLQHTLSDHFKGQTVSVEEVEEYVIAETPFYKFKTEALKPMEASRRILVTSTDLKRRKGTFPEGKTQIRFL